MPTLPGSTLPTALAWSDLRVTGDDAETFLQGQLTQDVAHVDERGVWSALLQPDSVVLAALWVKRDDEGFSLIVPSTLVSAVHARLRRFVLRAKCVFEPVDGVSGPFLSLEDQIEAMWPGESEFVAQLTPHTFGASFVSRTISFTKGCFTGQELVGRLDARGASVPWRLARVSGADVDALNSSLRSVGPNGPQGVTSYVQHDGHVEGLAIVHRTYFARGVRDDGVTFVTEVA